MNERIIRGSSISHITADYIGDEALSYRQITTLKHNLRRYVENNLASREYVDSLRYKPVISVTAYPMMLADKVTFCTGWG